MRWPSVYMDSPGIFLEKGCGEQGAGPRRSGRGQSKRGAREQMAAVRVGLRCYLSVWVRVPGRASGAGSVGKW